MGYSTKSEFQVLKRWPYDSSLTVGVQLAKEIGNSLIRFVWHLSCSFESYAFLGVFKGAAGFHLSLKGLGHLCSSSCCWVLRRNQTWNVTSEIAIYFVSWSGWRVWLCLNVKIGISARKCKYYQLERSAGQWNCQNKVDLCFWYFWLRCLLLKNYGLYKGVRVLAWLRSSDRPVGKILYWYRRDQTSWCRILTQKFTSVRENL